MAAYDTDLTDAQWARVVDLIPLAKVGGRPRTVNVRRVVDALMYVAKTGCQWRMIPRDFPPWRTVYEYFMRWRDAGVVRDIHRAMYFRARKLAGRSRYPSTLIVDSQSVRTTKMGGEQRGYDGGKRIKGRKRHTVVDSLGLPVAITVTAANVHDLHGGQKALTRASTFLGGRKIRKVYVDGAYRARTFKDFVKSTFSAIVKLGRNATSALKGFVPVSQRWVVERTFAWWQDYRRLVVDYERKVKSSRAMMRLASIRIILLRLDEFDHWKRNLAWS